MATRLKPSRINVDNTPRVGDGAAYQNDNDFHWSEGGGDMSYEDFEWVTLTGNSLVIENISNNVTPTGNFTVTAGTLRPGIEYILRVNTGNTPYTMTLGTGVTNPNGYSTELTPNKVNQFKFIATSYSQLELEGVDNATQSVAGLMSASDKTKLDGIESGAQVNSITGVKGNAESSYRTGNVNLTPANIGILNRQAASGGTQDSLVTTGDKYYWNNIENGVNTKTFYLAGDQDTSTAEDIINYYIAGKNPLISYGGYTYILEEEDPSTYYPSMGYVFTSQIINEVIGSSDTELTRGRIIILERDSISIIIDDYTLSKFIETNRTYQTPYNPTQAYNPATKKYVDDNKNTAGEGIEIGDVDDYSAMQGPAPDGFHVPLTTEWQAVYDVWTALGGGSTDGTNFGIALKLPFAGYRNYSSANVSTQGTGGRYWSSSRFSENGAYRLGFGSSDISPQSNGYRTYGCSVRCFKDTPVIPTQSQDWVKLYGTSIEAGGIFHNSTLGIISMSSNGATWITIADKNLGATQVWNNGDTLSEANCGKYYQWGNNYGFPRTGTIANQSTTQVDASNYGPGNYYSSDTFIKYSGSWDTTDNGNLRGGETGVVTIQNAITNTGVLSVNGKTGDVSLYSTISVTLTTAGWSSNSQTVSATGVTASNTVIVSPAPANIDDYTDAEIYCSAQGSGTLTFTCGTTPSNDIDVNVLILN